MMEGIELQDLFAALMMPHFAARDDSGKTQPHVLAVQAYDAADALMHERDLRQKKRTLSPGEYEEYAKQKNQERLCDLLLDRKEQIEALNVFGASLNLEELHRTFPQAGRSPWIRGVNLAGRLVGDDPEKHDVPTDEVHTLKLLREFIRLVEEVQGYESLKDKL